MLRRPVFAATALDEAGHSIFPSSWHTNHEHGILLHISEEVTDQKSMPMRKINVARSVTARRALTSESYLYPKGPHRMITGNWARLHAPRKAGPSLVVTTGLRLVNDTQRTAGLD